MRRKYFKIAKRIVEILLRLHHLLAFMEHYDVEFNHHYYHPDQHVEVVT